MGGKTHKTRVHTKGQQFLTCKMMCRRNQRCSPSSFVSPNAHLHAGSAVCNQISRLRLSWMDGWPIDRTTFCFAWLAVDLLLNQRPNSKGEWRQHAPMPGHEGPQWQQQNPRDRHQSAVDVHLVHLGGQFGRAGGPSGQVDGEGTLVPARYRSSTCLIYNVRYVGHMACRGGGPVDKKAPPLLPVL